MKLSQLRPCDACGGPVGTIFQVVRSSVVVVDPSEARRTLGLAAFFGGSLALAETMGADPDPVKIGGDENPELWTELFLCVGCWVGTVSLGQLAERVSSREAAAAEGGADVQAG